MSECRMTTRACLRSIRHSRFVIRHYGKLNESNMAETHTTTPARSSASSSRPRRPCSTRRPISSPCRCSTAKPASRPAVPAHRPAGLRRAARPPRQRNAAVLRRRRLRPSGRQRRLGAHQSGRPGRARSIHTPASSNCAPPSPAAPPARREMAIRDRQISQARGQLRVAGRA